MTIKEIVTKVSDDLAKYPLGWNTELKDFFAKEQKPFYTRKQKRVFQLVIREPAADEDLTISIHRTFAGARKAMEDDIKDTLALRNIIEEEGYLERAGECSAKIDGVVTWEITEETLFE